jgi:predicted transcriptional regulator
MLPPLEEIKRRRKALGIGQKELAKLAGTSQSLIAKIESGRINPSYQKAKAIFESLEALERREQVKAKEILTRKVISIQAGDPVSKAAKIMRELGFSQLPVFDGYKLVGSISERTILDEILRGKEMSELSKQNVESIMEDAFPCVGEDTQLTVISGLLSYVPAVLILKRGEVAGIITKADLLKVINR